MALQAPIERSTHSVLRAAVLELIETEPRRRFPAALHAGVPGRSVRHVDAGAIDAGLRADLALALMRRAGTATTAPHVWLTRPGELSVHDDDLRWLGPVAWAAAALGLAHGPGRRDQARLVRPGERRTPGVAPTAATDARG